MYRSLTLDLDHTPEGLSSLVGHSGSSIVERRKGRAGLVHGWQGESLGHLALDEERRTLVPTIGVLLEDSRVMLLWILAAFHHHRYQGSELDPSVLGVVHMSLSLQTVSRIHRKFERLTQSPFLSMIRARQCAPAAT